MQGAGLGYYMAVRKKMYNYTQVKHNVASAKKSGKKKEKKRYYQRCNYSEDVLKECLIKVRSKELSICRASRQYAIPKATLI